MIARSFGRMRAGLAALCFAAGLPTAALTATVDLPLAVGRLITGSKASVQLTNSGNQTITAWCLATTWLVGESTHREIETVDTYLCEVTAGLPGSSPRLDRLLPGQAREVGLDPLPSDARVSVVAVVLDDRTAIGDEGVISSIFMRRVAERDQLAVVVDAFNEVLLRQHGVDALEALSARLRTLATGDVGTPARAALDAVETYRRDAGGARRPEELDDSVRVYAAFVSREYELAKLHSQRRTRSSS